MNIDPDEPVRVATGNAIEMELLKQQLAEAGLEARVTGDSLDAGLGTAMPGSVELVVKRSQEERARAILGTEKPTAERQKFPHPVSDQKPERQGGHGPHSHYNADPKS